MIEAIRCNGDNDAAMSSAVPGGGPVEGNNVEPGLFPVEKFNISLLKQDCTEKVVFSKHFPINIIM